LAFIKLNLSLA